MNDFPIKSRQHAATNNMKTPWRLVFSALLIAVLTACAAGCVPTIEHYQRVELPDAVYLQGFCGGSGASNWAYYPYHGISISVNLSPLELGLHYPAGTTVELDSNTVTIGGWHQNEPIHLTVHLSPALHAALGNTAPADFDAMADPMDPDGGFGYHRSSKGHELIWANFIARDLDRPNRIVQVPMELERAKIVIPAMTINGQKYDSQELTITRKRYVGVTPINC